MTKQVGTVEDQQVVSSDLLQLIFDQQTSGKVRIITCDRPGVLGLLAGDFGDINYVVTSECHHVTGQFLADNNLEVERLATFACMHMIRMAEVMDHTVHECMVIHHGHESRWFLMHWIDGWNPSVALIAQDVLFNGAVSEKPTVKLLQLPPSIRDITDKIHALRMRQKEQDIIHHNAGSATG